MGILYLVVTFVIGGACVLFGFPWAYRQLDDYYWSWRAARKNKGKKL